MVTDRRLKCIISLHDYPTILDIIQNSTDDPHIVMKDITMTRTIYQPPVVSPKSDHQWLRIRVGDIDCEGNSKCTITYKKKSHLTPFPTEARIEVEDYYEATHMFDLLGFTKSSIQETRRTKYVCTYEEIKYIICFDIWPGLEDIIFLTIDSGPNAENTDLMGFTDLLEIERLAQKNGNIDVDTEYVDRYGTPASRIPRLKFDFFDMKHEDEVF